MAFQASYSRHRMLAEINNPLYSPTAGGDTYFLTPDEQRAIFLGNLMNADALPSGAAITTSATTTLLAHRLTGPNTGIVELQLTNFAVGTIPDNAALAFGASVISFADKTFVVGRGVRGVITCAEDERTTAVEVGLGTTVGSGAVSVLGGTAAFENVMGGTPSSAFTDDGATSSATINAPDGQAGGGGVLLQTTTPGLAVFLNMAGAAQDVTGAGAATFTGTIALEYVKLG